MSDIKYKLECKLFGGEGSDQYNALHTAFDRCAIEDGHTGDYAIYEWLDNIPKTSMVCNLVEALNLQGFDIVKRY